MFYYVFNTGSSRVLTLARATGLSLCEAVVLPLGLVDAVTGSPPATLVAVAGMWCDTIWYDLCVCTLEGGILDFSTNYKFLLVFGGSFLAWRVPPVTAIVVRIDNWPLARWCSVHWTASIMESFGLQRQAASGESGFWHSVFHIIKHSVFWARCENKTRKSKRCNPRLLPYIFSRVLNGVLIGFY